MLRLCGVVMTALALPESLLTLRTGPSCPHCEMQVSPGDPLCSSCGATLGQPPRRSGMTQRAMVLDAARAESILAANAPSPVITMMRKTKPLVRSWKDMALLVFTLGLGWFWLARRNTKG